MVIGYLKRCYH